MLGSHCLLLNLRPRNCDSSYTLRWSRTKWNTIENFTPAFPVQESFGAIRTVRSFAQEDYEVSRYSEKVEETLKLGLEQAVSFSNTVFYLHKS